MTSTPRHCPECGAAIPPDAPRGACPRCLLLRGLEPLPPDEPINPRATVNLVLAEETDGVLPFTEIGNYELIKEVGRGGMGVIYEARQRNLDRIVALKLIRAGALARTEGVARFKLEAAAAARLHHPNIVAVHEVGEHEGQHYYSMDYVLGRSLAAELRDGPFAPRRAAECVRDVAEAVHYAHEHGVIHRDLKPSNILLDAEGEPRVSDFGLAKLLHSDAKLSLSGAVLGSPSYMPPEQARGRHAEVSARSDVYSLGAILYECLTGRPPFTAATPLETMKLVLEQEPVSPRVLNRTLPRDLATICLKCLWKDPVQRYDSAEALAEDLDRWLDGKPIRAQPTQIWEHALKWTKRYPARAALVAVALLAPTVIITLLLVMGAQVTGQRNIAFAEAHRAEYNAYTARLNLYASDMYLTSRALEQGNSALARHTLAAHVPRAGEEDLRGFEWRHYWHLARGQQERVLGGFSNAVNCVAFSPDGRWLAAGSGNLVRKWDTTNFALVATSAHDPDAVVSSVAFSPDGTLLWSGDSQGKVRVWREGVPEPVAAFTRGTGWVHIAVPAGTALPALSGVEGSTVAISERDGTEGDARGAVGLYNISDVLQGIERGNVLTNSGGLAAFSRDGQWLLTSGGNDPLMLHNLGTGEARPLGGWTDLLITLALSPDGTRAAISASNGWGIGLYDLRPNAQPYWTTVSLSSRLRALAYSPDGQTLAAAFFDHTIRLLNANQGYQIHRFDGHTDQVLAVAFSPDGKTLASAGKDGTVRLWDPAALSRDTLKDIFPPFTFSPDQRTVSAGNYDSFPSTVMRHDLTQPNRPSEPVFLWRTGPFPELTWGHNGLLRWRLHGGATAEQWAKFEQFIASHTTRLASASAADGSVVAFVEPDGRVRIWHTFTAARLPDLQPLEAKLGPPASSDGRRRHLVLSDDGRTLAMSTRKSNVISFWDTATGTNFLRLPPRADLITDLVFSPDGRTLAVAGGDATVQLRDSRSGALQATLTGHEVSVVGMAFSPDGRTLVTADPSWVKLWHLPTRREVGTLVFGGIYLAFSPDGTLLLSANLGGGARLLRAPLPPDAAPPP